MLASTLSMILYTAALTSTPCKSVFIDLVKEVRTTKLSTKDTKYLNTFADAACKTSNPDVFWLLAYQESSFRFDIVRINQKDGGKILRGRKAYHYLRKLNRKRRKHNADIGALQINWLWHGYMFKHDSKKIMNPAEQVAYISEYMGKNMAKICRSRHWLECYHSPGNKERSKSYYKSILKKSQTLAFKALNYIKDHHQESEDVRYIDVLKGGENNSGFYDVYRSMTKLNIPVLLTEEEKDQEEVKSS